MKTLLVAIIFIAQLSVCSENNSSTEEIIRDDEKEQAERSVKGFKNLIENYKTSYVARGAHVKAHACVKAYLEINQDIDISYQYGLFSEAGKQYKSWIRFSNGHFDLSKNEDSKEDARGMASKVLNPPGTPLQLALNGTPTQNFVRI